MSALSTSPVLIAAAAGPAGGGMFLVAQFLLIGVIFWFFLIRPQQKRMKAHRAMIDAVKKGDTVITAGGIVGKAVKVDTDSLDVEIASGVRVKVIKGTLTDVQPLTPAKPAND